MENNTNKDNYKEKIKKIVNKEQVEKVKDFVEKKEGLAALTYIPIIGWLLPILLRRKNQVSQFHGNQALYLNIAIIIIYISIWILENFPITGIFFSEGAFLNPITGTIWLLSFVGFFVISWIAGKHAYNGEEWEIPYLKYFRKIVNRIMKLNSSD